MKRLHIDRLISPVGNGSTEPLNALLSNSDYAIVKIFNNIQGNLVLINEYICYRLAEILSLPIPKAGIGIIDKHTKISKDISLTSENFGPCFYSVRLNKVTIANEAIIKYISNKNDFCRVLLFDHLIYNKDRNNGNLLVSTKKGDHLFYIIDHTHVFKNQCIWDRFSLFQGIKNNDYTDTTILEYNKSVYKCFFQSMNISQEHLLNNCKDFQSKISKELLFEIVSDIPTEWNANNEDIAMLIDYLMYRIFHLEDMCKLIMGNFRR